MNYNNHSRYERFGTRKRGELQPLQVYLSIPLSSGEDIRFLSIVKVLKPLIVEDKMNENILLVAERMLSMNTMGLFPINGVNAFLIL